MVKVTTSPSLPEVIDGCAQSHIPYNRQLSELVTVTVASPPFLSTWSILVDSEIVELPLLIDSSSSEQPHSRRDTDNTIIKFLNNFISILFKVKYTLIS